MGWRGRQPFEPLAAPVPGLAAAALRLAARGPRLLLHLLEHLLELLEKGRTAPLQDRGSDEGDEPGRPLALRLKLLLDLLRLSLRDQGQLE